MRPFSSDLFIKILNGAAISFLNPFNMILLIPSIPKLFLFFKDPIISYISTVVAG